MELRFSPISNIEDPKLLLSVFELFAFARSESLFYDLDIDFDTILQDAEAEPAKQHLTDERELLRDEPASARQLVEELAMDSVFCLVEEPEDTRPRRPFVRAPTIVFQGILSTPYSETNIEAQNCHDQNCCISKER